MENNRYRNINELLNEIASLGDWRDVSEKSNFFKILSKITVIYHGYELEDESGKKHREKYPDEVMQAIVKACKDKFPTKEEVFDEDGRLKPGYPDYSNYLVLVNDVLSISLLGERTGIDEIAKKEFGIDVYHTLATKEEVDEMIQSSKAYLEKLHSQELDEAIEEGETEYYERKTREQIEAEAKIPAWIEKGKALIYPERTKEWEKCVKVRAGSIYNGHDLDCALILMEKLESGVLIEKVKTMLAEQGLSGGSAAMVRNIILHFSKRGPEFYESTAREELSEAEKRVIEDKKRENAELEKLHNSDSTKEVLAERNTKEKEIVDSLSEKKDLNLKLLIQSNN